MENINTNVQKFNEDYENINEQITTAAQRLTIEIKPLTPIERLTLPTPPPIDMKAITAKYSRMINESLHGNTTMNTEYKYTRDTPISTSSSIDSIDKGKLSEHTSTRELL
jgi:hypothetical protein